MNIKHLAHESPLCWNCHSSSFYVGFQCIRDFTIASDPHLGLEKGWNKQGIRGYFPTVQPLVHLGSIEAASVRGKTIHTHIKCCLILKYSTFALTPHNWSCFKVTHMPGEIEVDFSDWFLHDPDRVRIPVLAIVPIHTAQHTARGLCEPPFKPEDKGLSSGTPVSRVL